MITYNKNRNHSFIEEINKVKKQFLESDEDFSDSYKELVYLYHFNMYRFFTSLNKKYEKHGFYIWGFKQFFRFDLFGEYRINWLTLTNLIDGWVDKYMSKDTKNSLFYLKDKPLTYCWNLFLNQNLDITNINEIYSKLGRTDNTVNFCEDLKKLKYTVLPIYKRIKLFDNFNKN